MSETVLKRIRTSKNLSQSQLSAISGVNFRTLQDFEQGRKPLINAKGEMLYRLSTALDCTINDLLVDSISEIELDITIDNSEKNLSHLDKYHQYLSAKSLYGKYYTFPVIVPESKVNMKRVYPTKQELVYRLHNELYPDPRIISVMLFGSSITMQCNSHSDTDLSVRLDNNCINNETKNEISEKIQDICDWKADIIWYDRINTDDKIYHNICKGVQIV